MRKQQGLSLVELMISIALGLILMAGVMKIFVSSKVVFGTQQGLSRIQETGRLAIDFIARDVRMTGYYGATRKNNNPYALAIDSGVTSKGLNENFGVSIYGYDAASGAGSVLPHSVAIDLGTGITPVVTGSDTSILVIRAASQQGLVMTKDNTSNSLYAYSTAAAKDSAGCVDNICESKAAVPFIAVAADPYKAYVFQVSTLSLNSGSKELTVNHVTSWGGDAKNPLTMFGRGTELFPFNTTVYFIAQGNGADGGPSLYQKINNNDAVELLEGVERMRVTYACTTNTAYRLASALTAADWTNVQSVRIELVVRSIDDNVLSDSQNYTFPTDNAIPNNVTVTDRRMRQIFTTTIAPRSRMILN